MKKKGFTLIEIIVCIIILAIIGVSSFVGVKTLTKNITIDKLEQITDKALKAAEVYIESNKETYNQLYHEKNGVVIPLNVLVNEGLLDLKGTKLDDTDIKDEYVITAFMEDKKSSNGCVDIRTEASWKKDSSSPIYICTDSSGTSNLLTIGANADNLSKTIKERYYYRGASARNVVLHNGKYSNILYIDTDDSIVLFTSWGDIGSRKEYTDSSLDNFNIPSEYVDKMKSYDNGNSCYNIVENNYDCITTCTVEKDGDILIARMSSEVTNTMKEVALLNCEDYYNTFQGTESSNVYSSFIPEYTGNLIDWRVDKSFYTSSSFDVVKSISFSNRQYLNSRNGSYHNAIFMKSKLKPCVKISGGYGNYENPYLLDFSKCA